MNAIVPIPRCEIVIRPATMADLPFLDSLQKLHTKQVGWMPTAQFEGKIKLGHVIVAEDASRQSLGYCVGNDQYFKRDDCGIIYQLNVLPTRQRSLIGATLVKAMFDRAAWGCRLFCCWCAQDIEANYFWESLGFVPLAYRAGSRGKRRVHIFWQRRIRAGDDSTPYWFPAQTSSGSIREDRLVLPIPPNTHWRDEMPLLVLPEAAASGADPEADPEEPKRLPKPRQRRPKRRTTIDAGDITTGGLHLTAPGDPPPTASPKRGPRVRVPRPKLKNHPKLVAAARELRDRWLEQVNTTPLLPAGKYDVGRALEAPAVKVQVNPTLPRQLPLPEAA